MKDDIDKKKKLKPLRREMMINEIDSQKAFVRDDIEIVEENFEAGI